VVFAGKDGTPCLNFEPFADRRGERRPFLAMGEHAPHTRGEIGRERELAAVIRRDHGRRVVRLRGERLRFGEALEAENVTREEKGVAGGELVDEIFLDLTEITPAHRAKGLAPS